MWSHVTIGRQEHLKYNDSVPKRPSLNEYESDCSLEIRQHREFGSMLVHKNYMKNSGLRALMPYSDKADERSSMVSVVRVLSWTKATNEKRGGDNESRTPTLEDP